MKTLFLSALLAVSTIMAFGQHKAACCSKKGAITATKRFAMFASDRSFRNMHKLPGKLHYQGTGATITFKTTDGKTGSGYFLKAKKPTNNYVLVFQEWWGLNDYIRKESDKLYNDLGNVNVLAVDLYDGKIATTREEAGKYVQSVDEERLKSIIKGAIGYAGPKAKIATVGWCFGGGWSLQTGLMLGKQAAGVVMYYGMPEQDVARLKTLNADVLGIFANKDQHITPKVVEKFAADMKAAGKKLYLHQYDADHAFANPTQAVYNDASAKDAYKQTLAFLKARLR